MMMTVKEQAEFIVAILGAVIGQRLGIVISSCVETRLQPSICVISLALTQ